VPAVKPKLPRNTPQFSSISVHVIVMPFVGFDIADFTVTVTVSLLALFTLASMSVTVT